ncbi:PaaI family thioesterase [Luteimonas composti]|uniref:PaaI family thioesterase n=1 Tax=Luteimonas composti TaxID=398257 RepID=A0ABT6MQ61_9GAMM|nr:PaaI family thioesterase [Luteimonas composti]MDH7452738.1 PaaI family thioesterase [Luteimonas composti]
MSASTPDLSALIRERLPPALQALVPPPCLLDMQGELVDYEDGRELRMRFPVLPRYRNPLGNMQGGFIVAALDNTIGPFSFLVAPPSATASLDTQYLRPVTSADASITCRAWLVERTRNTLHIHAEARNEAGKIVVLAQSVNQLLGERVPG